MWQEVTIPPDSFLKYFSIEPEDEGRRVSKSTHVELATMFLGQMHTLDPELTKLLQPRANR